MGVLLTLLVLAETVNQWDLRSTPEMINTRSLEIIAGGLKWEEYTPPRMGNRATPGKAVT